MSFFGGLAAGFGEAQGQHNQRMLDFLNQKSNTMAQLYGHLADTIIQNGGDQDIAGEFLNRAKGWASANPIMDPKGYQQLVKGEKTGFHDLIEQSTQRKIANYNTQQFSGTPSQPSSFQNYQQATTGESTGLTPQQHDVPPSIPPMPNGGPLMAPGMPTVRKYDEGTMPAPNMAAVPPPTSQETVPPIQTPNTQAHGIPALSIPDMLTSITGGQPMYGSMGIPTTMGKMAMGIIPDVIKQRLEMQNKMQLISSMFDNQMGGVDKRSPTGSAQFSELMRSMGLNVPVTQWRPIARALFQDPNGGYFISPAMQSWKDGSTWLRTGPGQEVEVQPIDENPRIETAKDGSQWAITVKGPIKLSGQLPVQIGTSSSQEPTPGGGVSRSNRKIFTGGVPAASNIPPEPGTPSILPKGVQHPSTPSGGGPPSSRTSNSKPSEAYKNGGGDFNLEKLQNSLDPTDRSVANFIVHPESFDAASGRKEMWDREFQKRGLSGAPVPIKQLGADFTKQRTAIVNGMHAAMNIKNILTDTDGALVGMIAGRWTEAMNKLGSANMLQSFFGSGGPDSQATDFSPNIAFGKELVRSIAKEKPELAPRLLKNEDVIASKAADLITTMRLFNFADVRNVIGGVQGVAKTYLFLKSSLLNPGMDMPLILGHLASLDRNMADGLYTLESQRWGPKIPYIREKELLSNLYWDNYMTGMVNAVIAKHPGMSKQDAMFLLWRNGRVTADPGNTSGVKR